MTIVVEDGTGVPEANSYVNVADLEAYATARAMLLPDTEPAKEALLIKAMDYIELREDRFRGVRVASDQELSWPRTTYGMVEGIPAELKKAQLVLAMAAMNVDLTPVSGGVTRSAKRQTVGPITVEYATTSGAASGPTVPQAETLLKSLYGENWLSNQLRVVRA